MDTKDVGFAAPTSAATRLTAQTAASVVTSTQAGTFALDTHCSREENPSYCTRPRNGRPRSFQDFRSTYDPVQAAAGGSVVRRHRGLHQPLLARRGIRSRRR